MTTCWQVPPSTARVKQAVTASPKTPSARQAPASATMVSCPTAVIANLVSPGRVWACRVGQCRGNSKVGLEPKAGTGKTTCDDMSYHLVLVEIHKSCQKQK